MRSSLRSGACCDPEERWPVRCRTRSALQSRLRFLRGRPPEDDPTHLRMFSPDAMRALLRGFENVELSYVGGRYARLSARLFARDLVFTGIKP